MERAGYSGNTQPSNADQGGVQMIVCSAAAPILGSESLRQGVWSTVYSASPQSYSCFPFTHLPLEAVLTGNNPQSRVQGKLLSGNDI